MIITTIHSNYTTKQHAITCHCVTSPSQHK